MAVLGIDLGGTKLAFGIFNEEGTLLYEESFPIENRQGDEVGQLITDSFLKIRDSQGAGVINSIGISVPGIYHIKTGSVWAPNIPGWDDYPLLNEIKKVSKEVPVAIDSDRACYILGEQWQGNAKNCLDAIFLAVGTGIGAGILINGNVLRGAHDIAGAIGWMALNKPFRKEYVSCGCFEYNASGEGIVKVAKDFLHEMKDYNGSLKNKFPEKITSHDIFAAGESNDVLAKNVINNCIEYWGMAAANLVSLFNPEKIIFGGGVFGPAVPLIPAIKEEANKWGQPISIKQVSFEPSALSGKAGVYGAGFLALKNIHP